ncbi:Ankyrin repeat-containing YAR1 [Chlorella sorokiniana]|uniref:Ankyrin repeat-containing YAR1 n=1 Tax=Chlorella sorokiniana TaxID=3076 RepID=A0A2P6TVL6_CHLSO|nr:Ankyrin repeat-containing YAR1 [Chlorella sorokiniana]|eukprot:PRW58098.1 Ankyrin repeat-containing YAR1 [Chlorella sorokiniana]
MDGRCLQPAGWELPPWLHSGWVVDSMATAAEEAQGWPFLRTGVPPRVGQRLYMNIIYLHDGSHPPAYTGRARMVGHVTEVLPAPPPGFYGFYSGQRSRLIAARLRQLRAELPALKRCMAEWCTCGLQHPLEEMVEQFGAQHGQRIRAKLRLSCDDEEDLEPQLGGEFDAELILDDSKENMWVLCKMSHAGFAQLPLVEAYPPGKRAHKCWIQEPDQPGVVREEHPVPPLRQEQCGHCGAVGGAKKRSQAAPGGGAASVILLKACSACRGVWYCFEECQRAAWPAHKADCKNARMPKPATGAAAAPFGTPQPQQLGSLELLFWLLVAAAPPIFAALLGVLARYLEVRTTPPFPPLHLTAVVILFSVPTMLLMHTIPSLLLTRWRRQRAQWQRQEAQLQAAQRRSGLHSKLEPQQDSRVQHTAAAQMQLAPMHVAAAEQSSSRSSPVGSARVLHEHGGGCALQHAPGDGSDRGERTVSSSGSSSSADNGDVADDGSQAEQLPPTPAAVAGLPRVQTLPGLSRLYDRHPRWHRTAVLLAVASSYTLVIVLLNAAPKLVDPPVVMLVSMFTVLGVALLGRLWLKAPLPRGLLPAATCMIGGAAMVLVPNILDGAGQPGSLTTGRGWLGFAAAVGALLGTIVYLVLLQAFKHADLSAVEVLWWLTGVVLTVVLPLSLIIDGTDWSAQFSGMNGKDWAALLVSACVAHVGSVLGIQLSTWKLGPATVSMFFSLRVITSVVASKVILGATIVQTPLQIAGVVLVALAITCYMALQWWEAHRRQVAAAKAAATGKQEAV